jgi:drug/metabolite transporter (DMT)-like permease
MKWYLVFPFLSSVIYVVGVLLFKRAVDFRVGVWRMTFVSNVVAAVVFTALLPLGGRLIWEDWWQPAVVALLFVGGQVLSFLAFDRGDVSVVTPAMGVKTVCVAWFSTMLLATALPWQLWVSAVLSSLAIALLNKRGKLKVQKGLGPTIGLALVAAGCYALFDVLVQKWSPAWGAGRFLPVMFGMCAVFSLVFVPLFRAPLREIPRAAWPWLAGGVCGVWSRCGWWGIGFTTRSSIWSAAC